MPEPDLSEPSRLSLGALFSLSPVAAAGTFIGAAASGAFFSLAPIFAQKIGLPKSGIAAYMSAALIGGAVLMWPIGWLSDRMDRRIVVCAVSLLAAAAAFATMLFADQGIAALMAAAFLYGGTMLTLYALSVAHANDLLPQAQFLDAARGFNFIYGVGAAMSPIAIGALMTHFGPGALYLSSAALLTGLGVFALIRALTRTAPAVEGREEFVPVVTPSAECLEMYPHTPLEE
jgi:MFS family permease